ncbi:MAG TPA: hypothetical protein VFB59_05285 [Candidatus Saccharimonadales bacterium]|nr:hypothetical protein [Candidatus Saccharimonadales bacterium]
MANFTPSTTTERNRLFETTRDQLIINLSDPTVIKQLGQNVASRFFDLATKLEPANCSGGVLRIPKRYSPDCVPVGVVDRNEKVCLDDSARSFTPLQEARLAEMPGNVASYQKDLREQSKSTPIGTEAPVGGRCPTFYFEAPTIVTNGIDTFERISKIYGRPVPVLVRDGSSVQHRASTLFHELFHYDQFEQSPVEPDNSAFYQSNLMSKELEAYCLQSRFDTGWQLAAYGRIPRLTTSQQVESIRARHALPLHPFAGTIAVEQALKRASLQIIF